MDNMQVDKESKVQEEREANEKKIKYMSSKAEESLSKNKHLEALNYYTQVYDIIKNKGPFFKNDKYIISEKIVKILNIVAMCLIRQGKCK